MLGMTCSSFFYGMPGSSWLCGPDLSSKVATPPTPSQDMWTVAPANQQQAEQIVQQVSNQTVARQQELNSGGIQPVSTYGVPSSWIPDPSGSGDSSSIPWMLYLIMGISIVGVVMGSGGRRYR